MSSQWAADVKALGTAAVAAALGLTVRDRGVTNTSVSPCPVCHAERRSSSDPNPRGPIGLTADGLGWHCHRCQAKGDAVTLAALVGPGAVPGRGDTAGWRAVAAFCEAHGLCPPATPDAARRPRADPPIPRQAAPAPAPRRPPAAEVRAFWARCRPVTDDDAGRAWLESRAFTPARVALVAERDLARALPLDGPLPAWCQYLGASWRTSAHRVIVPLYGAGGRLESVHARAVAPDTPPKHKAASPRGAEVRGLVMADALGRLLLKGAAPLDAGRVIVTEGVPDFLTWATMFGDAAEDAPAVFGIVAGSWTPAIAATIPARWDVIIRTDKDTAGNQYAATIHASVAGRCTCWREPAT